MKGLGSYERFAQGKEQAEMRASLESAFFGLMDLRFSVFFLPFFFMGFC